jgi:hypothetical protein
MILAGAATIAVAAEKTAFEVPLAADEKIFHALARLTFGPRPGDVERVRSLGLPRWIEQQLRPDRIPQNPVLDAKLAPLETLGMSADEMVRNYPPPQVLRAMAEGRLPYPVDPERREGGPVQGGKVRQMARPGAGAAP